MSGPEVYDLVGVGFGPAAIAVAAAFEDEYEFAPPDTERLTTAYLERAGNSAWLPNLVLPGTDIQHHFLRDYATPRNPRSRFSFPNYLKETGRFYPFTLMANYVTRQEWSEYTLWTVRQLDQNVRYHAEVLDIAPCTNADRITTAAVQYRDVRTGRISETLARNVMISTGHEPYVPELFAPHTGGRIFHSSEYLTRVAGFDHDEPLRIAVIGAGQTAGEIFLHLAQSFPNAQLYSLARNSGIRLYELGHFSNEAYFPEETDYFYELDTERRRRVFGEQRATNYAAVDPDLSTAWYRTVYDDKYFGPGRLHMRKRTAVESVTPTAGGVRLGLREVYRGTPDQLDVDLVVLCTGYREPSLPSTLASFAPFIPLDEYGYPHVTKAHRVVTSPGCEVGIYLNGITEWRHGINSATSFSTLALKAGRITEDIKSRHEGANHDDEAQAPEHQALGSERPDLRGEVQHLRRPVLPVRRSG